MRDIDQPDFDRGFSRLCAGFDTPPTQQRKDAYWQGFRKHTLTQFTWIVDVALTTARFESMPTVGALRKLLDERTTPPVAAYVQHGPTLQEQLCEYVMLTRYPTDRRDKFSPDQMRQTGQPWTYLYREWVDEGRKTPLNPQGKCAECSGVLIPAHGALEGYRVNVADMLADPVHTRMMERWGTKGHKPKSAAA